MIDNDKFLIFKPAKSSMQSGLNNTTKWCLSNCEMDENYVSSKFCWIGSTNPEKQMKLFFDSLESAESFAMKNNYDYEIIQPKKRKILKKSYSENFTRKN